MASWRAHVKVPCEIDEWVRNQASANRVKLKDFLASIIESGLRTISLQGTGYQFLHTQLASETLTEVEYIVDESYRNDVQSQSHLLSRGKGKQQKIFLETLLIAHAAFQAAQTATELADGVDETVPESETRPSEEGNASKPAPDSTKPS